MVDPRDLVVAQQLADEVRQAAAGGRRRSWRKVTTLLTLFGAGRFTHQVQSRMTEALAAVGVSTFPPLAEAKRADSVRLSVDDLSLVRTERRAVGGGDVTEQRWPVPAARSGFTASGERLNVRWFDLDANSDAQVVLPHLQEHCEASITLEMVEDLLTADPQPKVVEYESAGKALRAVSVVGVTAGENTESGEVSVPETATTTGQLTFQLVEFLVGPDWLVSCWHPSRTCTGSSHERDGDPVLKGQIVSQTRIAWTQGRGCTGGDLGLCFTRALVDTYRHAHHQAEAWLEQWEFESFEDLSSVETVSLTNMLSLVADFRRRLAAFNQAREVTDDRTWFSDVSDPSTAEKVDAVLDRALKNLKLLFDTVRSDMEIVTMQAISDQAAATRDQAEQVAKTAELAREQRDASERLQRKLEKIAALLLVPALIAGIFGANTQLPGYGSWAGFITMLVLMVVSGSAIFLYMRTRDRAESARVAAERAASAASRAQHFGRTETTEGTLT